MPFVLKAAQGGNFVNRDKLLKNIFNNLKDKNSMTGYALIGMRRIGKTSIFLEMEDRLKKCKGVVPVYFSIWDLLEGTVCEFNRKCYLEIVEAFRRELSLKYKIRNLLKVAGDKINMFLKTFDVSINILDDIELKINKKDLNKKEFSDLFENLFLLPDKLAGITKTKCVIFIDEFPSIQDLKADTGKRLGSNVIKKIRSINEKYKNTVLNISGSLRKAMDIVALEAGSPFFRQFEVVKVKPFDENAVELLLKKNLGKKTDTEVSKKLFQLTGGIPFYVQVIGKDLLKETKISVKTVEIVFDRFIEEEGTVIFREELNRLSSVERRIALKMAKQDLTRISIIGKAIGESMNVTGRFLEYLINKGVVYKESKGIYHMEDKVFKEWIKRQ